MMAKRIKKATEKMQEVEMERRIIEEGGGMQEIGTQIRSQAIVRTQKIELNP